MRLRHHVFVCANARPDAGRPSCAARGAEAILTSLALRVLERGLADEVAVTSSGCLGPCFEGPNVVVYPDGVWYGGVGEGDVAALVEHLAGGPVVQRLLRGDDDDWAEARGPRPTAR
jgi:(2Fe-2S) ferredoxin